MFLLDNAANFPFRYVSTILCTFSGVWLGTKLEDGWCQCQFLGKLVEEGWPDTEFTRNLRRNYRLGTRTTPGTLDTMQRQAGVPHTAHEQRHLVIGERDRTGRLFEIFGRVVQGFV
jgi:hypothetical protein